MNPNPYSRRAVRCLIVEVRKLRGELAEERAKREAAEKALVKFLEDTRRHNIAIEKAWREGVAKLGTLSFLKE